ncbi:MAG: molybdate ABC transporter substrate-binding protein [Parvibaculaceae bacterium]
MIRALAALWCLFSLGGPALASGAACEPISIFAAASTTDAIEAIARSYEHETACSVSTVFAASGTLARQIEAGAPADLFLSANPDWMDWLQAAGKVRAGNRTNLLGNDLVLVVPRYAILTGLEEDDLSSRIRKLVGSGRLAIGDPASVPAGRYAAEALEHLGLASLLRDQTVRAGSVRVALAWVARGEAPAAIVYRTDALTEDGVRLADELTLPDGREIVYPLALIGRVPNRAARAFYDYLQSYDAAVQFADRGFRRISTE